MGEHLSNECWLAFHEYCFWPDWCECMCHLKFDWEDAQTYKFFG